MNLLVRVYSRCLLWACWTRVLVTYWASYAFAFITLFLRISHVRAPHASDREISRKWLRGVMQRSVDFPVPLPERIEIVREGLRGGFQGQMFKLLITWPESCAHCLPGSVVVKLVGPSFRNSFLSIMYANYREAIFYDKLSSELQGCVPHAYYASGSWLTGSYIILMEDLSGKAILGSHLLGNQCWGEVAIPKQFQQEPVAVLEAIFLKAAEIHARYWRDTSLLSMGWLKGVSQLLGKLRHWFEAAIFAMGKQWRKIQTAVRQKKTNVRWSDMMIRTMEQALAQTSWEHFRSNFDITQPTTPFTLCHGDFHASNTLWTGASQNPVVFVDWSEVGVGCPFTELAQFMISNATIDLRRRHEKQLFELYHRRLIELGVDAKLFPLSECWDRYKYGGIERWLQLLTLLAEISLNDSRALSDSAVQWFHDQVHAFVQDHAESCKRTLSLQTIYTTTT